CCSSVSSTSSSTFSKRSPARGDASAGSRARSPERAFRVDAARLVVNVDAPRLPLRTASLLWTAPNVLTFFRIALVPLLVYLLRGPGRLTEAIAAFLFLLAALTDYFDGYLA